MPKKVAKKTAAPKVTKKARAVRKKSTTKALPSLSNVPSPVGFGLCKVGEQYWRSVAPKLVELNLLTALHLETFAELCRMYGEYRTLSKWLIDDPSRCTFSSESGYESESPQVRMRDKALANLQKLWPKFGLHPHALEQLRKHGGIPSSKGAALKAFSKGKNS